MLILYDLCVPYVRLCHCVCIYPRFVLLRDQQSRSRRASLQVRNIKIFVTSYVYNMHVYVQSNKKSLFKYSQTRRQIWPTPPSTSCTSHRRTLSSWTRKSPKPSHKAVIIYFWHWLCSSMLWRLEWMDTWEIAIWPRTAFDYFKWLMEGFQDQ